MSSVTNNSVSRKRTIIFSVILLIGLIITDHFIDQFNIKEKKAQISLEIIQSDKILTSEVYRLLYGLEDDFNFFERKFKYLMENKNSGEALKTLIEFLNTHPYYFKVRITDNKGQELFKIVQRKDQQTYEQSLKLFDLSRQDFYKELQQVNFDEFYFSSMEPNIINGKIENPIRPTVRVSKRIKLTYGQEALLILNIDGKKILQLFEGQTIDPTFSTQKILVDHKGYSISSYPLLPEEDYTKKKINISTEILKNLGLKKEIQGSFTSKDDNIIYTRLPLPKSSGTWYLISIIPESSVKRSIYNQRLTRIFWELLVFVVLIFWFWRDEKKRHKEQVVQVLLEERSQFIQNVSHQLKTPLTIIHNYLNKPNDLLENRKEMEHEVDHMIKLIEDFLLLSQIESLQSIPTKKENLLEILNETISLVGEKARAKSISIRLNLQEELMDALQALDKNVLPELLKSAFLNILDNAIDFSPNKSTITISISIYNAKIVIRFQDQGAGVPDKEVSSLFERKIKVSSDSNRKGSGLGLAITKKILELHQGEINYVRGQNGACFDILI
jgi:signal transduction histidine kinase